MDYFNMEREAMKGKKPRNTIASSQSKLQESYNGLIEKQKENAMIRDYDTLSEQKQNIKRAGFGLAGTNSSIRRKTLSEKYQYQENLKNALFINSVYDIFMEALLLDDDFKDQYAGNLYRLVEETTLQLMSERNITLNSLSKHSSLLMQNIIDLCEETAKCQADEKYNVKDVKNKEILNEKNKKTKDGKLMESDAKREFDCEKEYETQTIAEAIKDKVVAVVRREQELAEQEKEINSEIESETEPLEELDRRSREEMFSDVDGLPMDEAAGIGDDPLFHDGHSTADIERLAVAGKLGAGNADETDEEIEDGNHDDEEYDARKTESEILHRRIRKHGILQESLFKSLQMNIAQKSLQEQKLNESSNVELNMDMVFAEALAYYTLLETLHTARIVEFKPSEVRKMAKEFSHTPKRK